MSKDEIIKFIKEIDKVVQQEGYTSLSTRNSALDYLRRCKQFIIEMEEDPISFKWVAIALHGALYSYAACKAASIHGHNKTTKYLKKKDVYKLLSIWKLLKKCNLDTDLEHYKEHLEFVITLIRNTYQHPKTTESIFINNKLFPNAFSGVLTLILRLINTCRWFDSPSYKNYKAEAISLIESSIDILAKNKTYRTSDKEKRG